MSQMPETTEGEGEGGEEGGLQKGVRARGEEGKELGGG